MYQQPTLRFSMFPPVIKNLLIINGLFYIAQMGPLGDILGEWLALWPIGTPEVALYGGQPTAIPRFWPWQLITYGFLHGGFSHILFNMFALWMFGAQIENTWGSNRFAVYYFLCVIGAAIAQLTVAWLQGGIYPTIGASGGVFGILLAFGLLFPNQPIYLILFPVPIKAKWFVTGYGAIELFNGITTTGDGIAHFAHLGGMLAGGLLILYWRGHLPIKPSKLSRY